MPRTRKACSPRRRLEGDRILDEVESLADALGVDQQTAVQLILIEKLERVAEVVIEPPRASQQDKEVLVTVVTVVTSGTPVQGPTISVPRGYPTIIRQRRHTGNTRTGYVAFGRNETANNLNRIQLRDNDSIALRLSRLDSLWFDSDNNDTSFELIAEYGQRSEVG